MNRFVVSVRRGKRSGEVSADLVRNAPGVTVLRTTTRGRLIIHAEISAISAIRERFGDLLIIEPEIMHTTL